MDPLQSLPGVGPRIAADLRSLGIRKVSDMAGADPEELYRRLEDLRGAPVDRCVLYVFRCAVHGARTPDPDPELRLWWRWKDRR